jgi:hypothetical protein
MTEYIIRADEKENRLYILIRGVPTPEAVAKFKADIEEELSKLKPGFTILNDASDFHPGMPKLFNVALEIAHIVALHKPSLVARLANPLARAFLSKVTMQVGYNAEVFDNIKEAIEYLDQFKDVESD